MDLNPYKKCHGSGTLLLSVIRLNAASLILRVSRGTLKFIIRIVSIHDRDEEQAIQEAAPNPPTRIQGRKN